MLMSIAVVLSRGSKETETEMNPTETSSVVFQFRNRQMKTTLPNGITVYGRPRDVVARRTINQVDNTIVEDTWHGTEQRKTLFKLRPNTLVFEVTDEANTFTGTMTFTTRDWLISDATYDITMSDECGSITGIGTWTGETYNMDKMFADPSGDPPANNNKRSPSLRKLKTQQRSLSSEPAAVP